MIEQDKIAKLTDELNLYKKKALNRRRAIKSLQAAQKTWQNIAQKYMAMHDEMRAKYNEQSRITYYIAKCRAIEAGLVNEEDTKQVSGARLVQGYLNARIKDYRVLNGEIE